MRRYADLAYTLVMVWTLLGMFVIVGTAAAFGPDSIQTYIAAGVFFIPFFTLTAILLAQGFGSMIADEWKRARR